MPDVDGFTSAVVFYNYLNDVLKDKFNFEIEYHIPEGKEHGLEVVAPMLENKKIADLIVCPDSSSNDYEYHKTLHDMGYDILVLDHHIAEKYSEDAIVVNNQLSQNYGNKSLSGVGVVYKFFEHFEKKYLDVSALPPSENYLDLVALGQISDVMLMNTIENRFICDYGLTHVKNQFFKEIVEKQSYSLGERSLTQMGVAFYITPLINALIRVGSSIEKERLFEAFINPNKEVPSTKRGEKGLTETITTQSIRNCVNAKARQKRETDKALELLSIQIEENCLNDNKILILNADDLDVSNTLTGLCAMGVASAYKKPVMLGRVNKDGYMKGSIRGCGESELRDFRQFLLDSEMMEFVEGHANAAGFSLKAKNVEKLIDYANKELANINFNEGCYDADFVLKSNCLYLSSLISEIDNGRKFWGQGNPEPVIVVKDIDIDTSNIQIIGSNKDTVKFVYNGVTYIKFKAADLIKEFGNYGGKIKITVVGKGNMNYWGGRATPQIIMEAIEIKDNDFSEF